MTVEEIMKLLDAGYTKADIDKLIVGDAGKGDQGGDGGKDDRGGDAGKGDQGGDAGKGDQGGDGGKGDQGAAGKNEPGDAYAALMESVKDLKATVEAIQKSNINNANKNREETKTVEDLVADFTKDM